MRDRLFEFASGAGDAGLSTAGIRQQAIAVNFDAVSSNEAREIEIVLFDNKVLRAVQRESEGFIRHAGDSFTWSGRISTEGGWTGDVILTVHKDAMAGSVYTNFGVYSILPQADGRHVLQEVNPSAFPQEQESDAVVVSPTSGLAPLDLRDSPHLDNGSQIDVLIVYSDDVRAFLGGATQAMAFAQQAIAVTNTGYQNSAMTVRARLVHTMELNYTESNNTGTDLSIIRDNVAVAAARNIYQADAVGFLVQNATNACGTAYLMQNSTHNSGFGSSAYSVSVRSCAVDNLTFPHELGHNQGANHNPENGIAPASAVFPYAFGHYVNGGSFPFRTILSTTSNGICTSCPRIPHFSNASVLYNGQPTGLADQRENARAIDGTALVFSRFRNSALAVASLRSRKIHAGTPHDVDLRPGEPRGIECRAAGPNGSHQLLVTFVNPVSVGGVAVTSSNGQATATSSVNGAVVTIDLASVADAQTLSITLSNVTVGTESTNVVIQFPVLLGDTNSDGSVNAGDTLQTRSRSGEATDATNFRSDVNTDGTVNGGDAIVVRNRSGNSLP
jgi:hypothetical protein